MPYSNVEDLPSVVRDSHPISTEIKNISVGGSPGSIMTGHRAILQGLDQWLPTPHPWILNKQLYHGVDNFTGTEQRWDTIPLIYVPGTPVHPSTKALRENFAAEVRRVGGRVVGGLAGSAVLTQGTPRLESEMRFSDLEVQNLYEAGKLSHSTGFDAPTDPSGKMHGKVEPSHVLLFDLAGGVPPNDPKAMILNLGESETMAEDPEIKGILNKISTFLEKLLEKAPVIDTEPAGDPVPVGNTGKDIMADAELLKQVEVANLAAKEKDATIADLKAQLTEHQNLAAKAEQEKKEARWIEIKNLMPKGVTAKPEKEAEMRKEWESDPSGFAMKVIQHVNTKTPPTKATGAQHVNLGTGDAEDKALTAAGVTGITIMTNGGE